jgi:hypothetical protein
LSNFVVFPWTGMVFAGACLGVLVDNARGEGAERRLNLWFAAAGTLGALSALAASLLPSPYRVSDFWSASPSFFAIRLGAATAAIAGAYAWSRLPVSRGRWSPIAQLGRTSLFIYWIHVEMVYGLVSRPLHHAIGFRDALLAYVVFTAFMLGCSIAKDRVAARLAAARHRPSGSETLQEGRRITS